MNLLGKTFRVPPGPWKFETFPRPGKERRLQDFSPREARSARARDVSGATSCHSEGLDSRMPWEGLFSGGSDSLPSRVRFDVTTTDSFPF